MRKVKKILKWLAILYFASCILLYFFQHKIIFQPQPLPINYLYHFDHSFEELFLNTPDGEKLNALHFRSKNPKGVLLYFHGNRGNLKRWGEITTFFVNKNYDVIVMDYRSYGKSTGNITEQNLYEDAQLFYEYARKNYPENEIIIYGRSLGTGIAAKLASVNEPGNLILETPYYSMKELASNKVPVLPVSFLLKFKLPNNEFVDNIKCPITIYHGTKDEVVPYSSGKRLFDSIPSPHKRMITIEGGKHNNLITFDEYKKTIDEVLER